MDLPNDGGWFLLCKQRALAPHGDLPRIVRVVLPACLDGARWLEAERDTPRQRGIG
jgi:hypothetical protein